MNRVKGFFKKVGEIIKGGLSRYYMSTIFVLLFWMISVYYVRSDLSVLSEVQLSRIKTMALATVYSAFTAFLVHSIEERIATKRPDFKWGHAFVIGISLIGAIGWGSYFWDFDPHVKTLLTESRLALAIFSIFVLAVCLPYFKKLGLGSHAWRIVEVIMTSFVISLVLFWGVNFLTMSMNFLFSIRSGQFWFNDFEFWAVFSGCLVFPMLLLSFYSNISPRPQRAALIEQENNSAGTAASDVNEAGIKDLDAAGADASEAVSDMSFEESSASDRSLYTVDRLLLYYVVMPVLFIYTIMLYLYFGKLLITWEMPNNIMANLVVWYMFASHVFLYLMMGIKEGRNRYEEWVLKNKRKYIAMLALPAVMLYVSVFIRIGHYGYTAPRYFLLMFAIFNTAGLALLFFMKERAQVGIAVMLLLLGHISLYGELSYKNVVCRSQVAQIEKKMDMYGYDLYRTYDPDTTSVDIFKDGDYESVFDIRSSAVEILNVIEWDEEDPNYRIASEVYNSSCDFTGVEYVYANDYGYDSIAESKSTQIYEYNYGKVFEIGKEEYMAIVEQYTENTIGDFKVMADGDSIRILMPEDYKEDGAKHGREIVSPLAEIKMELPLDVLNSQNADKWSVKQEFEYAGQKYEVIGTILEYSYFRNYDDDSIEVTTYSVCLIIRKQD